MTHSVHIYLNLERDSDGYPPVAVEELDAVLIDERSCRVVGIPVFAYGIAPGDVVSTGLGEDGRLWATGVIQPGAHWVFRLIPFDRGRRDLKSLAELGVEFEARGCRVQPSTFGLLAVDVPSSVDASAMVDLLTLGESSQRWHFDLGVDPIARQV